MRTGRGTLPWRREYGDGGKDGTREGGSDAAWLKDDSQRKRWAG